MPVHGSHWGASRSAGARCSFCSVRTRPARPRLDHNAQCDRGLTNAVFGRGPSQWGRRGPPARLTKAQMGVHFQSTGFSSVRADRAASGVVGEVLRLGAVDGD